MDNRCRHAWLCVAVIYAVSVQQWTPLSWLPMTKSPQVTCVYVGITSQVPWGKSYGGLKMAMVLADMTIRTGNFFCVQVI